MTGKKFSMRHQKGMGNRISQAQYDAAFEEAGKDTGLKRNEKKTAALEYALEIRKFEIDLYWKRATYFWAFIGATLAGYGVVRASPLASGTDLPVVLSCLGVVFSFGWFCVNKGSKCPEAEGLPKRVKRFMTGPGRFSVSKINQIISLFVAVLWLLLLWKSLPPFSKASPVNWEYVGMLLATLAACILFVRWGKTEPEPTVSEPRSIITTKRKSEIDPLA